MQRENKALEDEKSTANALVIDLTARVAALTQDKIDLMAGAKATEAVERQRDALLVQRDTLLVQNDDLCCSLAARAR